MKQRNLRGNNRGLSLVELLVAVAVLGIIVLPLLHTFFTSAATASKSREVGEETLAAQNVAEQVEATGLGNLGSLGTVEIKDSGDPTQEYDLTMNGVGGGKYDAKVTLTGTDEGQNTVYTPMDAVFTQEGGTLDPDKTAKAQFLLEAGSVSDTVTEDEIKQGTVRTIDIGIDEAADGTYEYSCAYHYSCRISYTDEDGKPAAATLAPVDYSYVFYNGTYDSGKSGSLASLYFFFNEGSNQAVPNNPNRAYNDTITVTRKTADGTCTPVSVFLVRQNQTDGSSDPTYSLLVQLKGSGVSNTANGTKVYCNVSSADYRVFDSGGVWYEKEIGSFGKLVATDQRYRIYDMTVEIDDPSGNKLYTLKGSKLG